LITNIYIYGDGNNNEHDEQVAQSFIDGYESAGGSWAGTIDSTTKDLTIAQALAAGNQVYIYSYSGMSSLIAQALASYPGIQVFASCGANSPGEIFDSNNGIDLPSLIITGGGDTDNETADDIEFFSNDPVTPEATPDEQDLSSFSNGFVAGQIAYIADERDCTIWEARYCARITASENGIWHETNGYGKIEVEAAIAYAGSIPEDTYKTHIGVVGVITATRTYDGNISVTAGAVENADSYEIQKSQDEYNWEVIGTGLNFSDTINLSSRPYYYRYTATFTNNYDEVEAVTSEVVRLNYTFINELLVRI
jgi:hypothetical protein